jgi:hypothetical protein
MIHSIVLCVHRAPHLLALEVQKYVCAPDALQLPASLNAKPISLGRQPANGYKYVF